MENYTVKHNKPENRFEITIDGLVAVLEYSVKQDSIIFSHTGVPKELEGKGVGSALVKSGLDYAIESNLKIIPLCPFVKAYIQRHPEYSQDKS